MAPSLTTLTLISLLATVSSFTPSTFLRSPSLSSTHRQTRSSLSPAFTKSSSSALEATGIFFGTSTGLTEEVADVIYEKLNALKGDGTAVGPFAVDDITGALKEKFSAYSSLILGTPTWNTGSDTERSGTAWDELYYEEMNDLTDVMKDKKTAVFGLGDQLSYSENYADASGELHDVVQKLGAKMLGYTDIDASYKHEESLAIRDGKFCGLMCDNVNQMDMTEGRVDAWLKLLDEQGMFDDAAGGGAAAAAPPVVAKVIDVEPVVAAKAVVQPVVTAKAAAPKGDDWTPYYNANKGSTMWINKANGRESFYTFDNK